MTPEEFFLSELSRLYVGKDPKFVGNLIFKDKDDIVLMYYEIKHSYLHVNNECIWSVFESRYGLKYNEIQDIIRDVMLKHLNWKVKTPINGDEVHRYKLLKHLKWKKQKEKNVSARHIL